MNSHTEQGDKSHMAGSSCDSESFFKASTLQIREDLQSLSQSDKTCVVFIGECLCFYLLQPLSSSYHVQHSLEFQPPITVL